MPDSDTSAPITDVTPDVTDTTPVVDTPPDYSSPNDLTFEMTAEQEAEYVKQVLETGNYTAPVEAVPEIPPAVPTPAPTQPVAPPVPEPTPPPVVTPAETTTPQTDDLWVEVEQVTVDDLGEETTKTVKLVYDPSDPSSFIPDDFTAKSTKQLADIMDAKAEMARLYGERQSEYDTKLATEQQQTTQDNMIKGWDTEISDLIDSGLIPKPKVEVGDPNYAKDPSVELTTKVFEYMTGENNDRVANGKPVITSFGTAFTLYQNDAKVKADAEAKIVKDKETKQKGAMIGGASSASARSAEVPAYKSGSHSSIWDVPITE